MTSLTSLELISIREVGNAKPLQSLPLLQRLALEGCATLGQRLMEPGAFASLQELHISADYPTESGFPDLQRFHTAQPRQIECIPPDLRDLSFFATPGEIVEEDMDTLRALMKAKAVDCMSAVLQRPHIQLSGCNTLFKLGLP